MTSKLIADCHEDITKTFSSHSLVWDLQNTRLRPQFRDTRNRDRRRTSEGVNSHTEMYKTLPQEAVFEPPKSRDVRKGSILEIT